MRKEFRRKHKLALNFEFDDFGFRQRLAFDIAFCLYEIPKEKQKLQMIGRDGWRRCAEAATAVRIVHKSFV